MHIFNHVVAHGQWNDAVVSTTDGYIVEWDTQPGDPPADAPAVPEPSAALLFLPALAAVAVLRQHRA